MLASALNERGVPVTLYGDGCCNTPPLGLVHLFAGRSFRRRDLEVEAFEAAVRYWRARPEAAEFEVERSFEPGDRLDRSVESAPVGYRPLRVGPGRVRYGPAFSVESQRLAEELSGGLEREGGRLGSARGLTVWAGGLELGRRLAEIRWDYSHGALVRVRPGCGEVKIGVGVHLAPHPHLEETTIGGDLKAAGLLHPRPFEVLDQWEGRRLAPARDRWPAIGWLKPAEFVFGGFGSRGLFWLPWAVKVVTGVLLDGDELPPEIDWRRLIL